MGRRDSSADLKKAGEALELGAMVAAICGATAGLANNGYLNSRKHTSNDLAYMKMVCPHYKGEPFYEIEPAVSDENLVTASGTAPLEFAREVLKKIRRVCTGYIGFMVSAQ